MLAAEYGQLAGLPRPEWFGPSTVRVFTAKAEAAKAGRCLEPEDPAAWPRGDKADFVKPNTDVVVTIGALRAQTLSLLAATTSSDQLQKWPDLAVARAHLLGRFDCILAFGRTKDTSAIKAACIDEYYSAAAYVGKALDAAPAAATSLCPRPAANS